MATIIQHMQHENGIPLGGIGTGSIDIRPDGYFHEWQIFNVGRWAPRQPEQCTMSGPEMQPGALAFHVWTRQPGRAPVMRRLGMRTDQHNLYSCPWLKSVREIEFEGRYPVATLQYKDGGLPVSVTATLFSPFIPHDARTSGTPGCHIIFTLKNLAAEPVTVSLLGVLKNPLAWGADDRKLTNTVSRAHGATLLTMRTAATAGCPATHGSMALSVSGGKPSWIAGEYPQYLDGFLIWNSAYGMRHESCIHEFRATGSLPNTAGDHAPSGLLRLTDGEINALPLRDKARLIRALWRYAFARSLWRRVATLDPKTLRTSAGLATFLKEVRQRLEVLAGKDRAQQNWGDGALASTVTVAPAEEKEIRFTLAWYFPRHFSAKGPVLGHMYENWFRSAEDVNRFLVSNAAQHRAQTCAFAQTLADTTLDPEQADAWAGQLTTLAKCTWWTKDGSFAVWEGLGCCGFHTTDITYQGSFNILALFPELQKQQMAMGARFQRADGRVHHFFTPDFSAVDNGFDRVDMNQQFVLLVCRDYLWTGDRKYLRGLWPAILKAMANTAQLDRDGDGLPDHDTRRNTYDAWNFFGTPSYIASLWLSALRAAIRLAEDLGQRSHAARWRGILKKGAASFERKLWNGRYYSLWVHGKERDECCMSDQIDGEWFTQLIGLGHCLPRERVRAALRAIVKHNFSTEAGLINASYPPGAKPRMSTHGNLQATAPWTGIEYAIASMLFDFGMPAEGAAVVKNIHERYLRAGRFWNHVECGDHYYRAMSSWAVLLAATGFKIDVPRQTLTVAPAVRQPAVRAPWVSASGWGHFEHSGEAFVLHCSAGRISFRELRLGIPAKGLAASLNGRRVGAKAGAKDGLTVVSFRAAVNLKAGDTLVVAP
ncbi:MAG: GH116 family glycosyl hydrolase [Planctomycetota bacterium]|nr:GH116 family glycosyl hydrolase [Planctomycetota bacterium]